MVRCETASKALSFFNLLVLQVQLSGGREEVFAELNNMVSTVCQRHGVLLGQVWLPLRAAAVNSGSISETPSISTQEKSWILDAENGPFCMNDHNLWGFRQACVEHKLEIGQVKFLPVLQGNFVNCGTIICEFFRLLLNPLLQFPLFHPGMPRESPSE